MKIVENGHSVCGIIIPKEPTPRETFAAEELISYIKQISGAELRISDEYENSIIIGEPDRNEVAASIISQEEFEDSVPGPEGFIIKATENSLLLAGSSKNVGEFERGTVYAVYEFLERFLDCSLAAYCKKGVSAGEFVPKRSDISISTTTYIKNSSDVKYRTAIVQYGPWVGEPDHPLNDKFISWLAKNRYNRILTWSGVYESAKKNGMLNEMEKRGIVFSVGHHQAFSMLIPPHGNEYFPEHYEETHPEYYKLMEDGSRYKTKEGDYSGQLIWCMRNEELIAQVAENVLKWTDANPQVDIICLWPHDGKHEQCCCEECQKYCKSDNYTYFINKIAEIVSKTKPHIKIDRTVYLDMRECNFDNLSPSMMVNQALWHDDLRTIGKPDGSCFANTEFEESIMKWKKAGATAVYYDYLMGAYCKRQKWMPAADEMQAECKRFCEMGIYGLGTQIEPFNMWNHIFNFYSYGRTAYNTDLSMDDNLEIFCKIFGSGGEYVKEVIRYGEEVLDGQTTISYIAKYFMERIDKDKIYALYEKAFDAAENEFFRNNIRLMRMVFRYSDLEISNPLFTEEDTGAISPASDETGELWYMHEHFDSFTSKKEGYGIAFPVEKRSDAEFVPDKWYLFE